MLSEARGIAVRIASHGFPIHAVHYASTLPGVVNDPCIIASATGVPCIFYGNFARYLASQGTPTLCFDYRFIGNSFPLNVDLKNQEERIAALKEGKGTTISGDYVLDMESAVDYLASEYPNRKIVALTHSVGGHVLPLMEPRYLSLISRAITLGCMNPSFEGSSVGQAREESCALAIERTIQDGYWPARSLGQGHDLPSGVLIEWFNWMKYTTYWAYGNEDRLQRYRTPTYSIALFDDVIAEGKPEMTDMILKSLPNAPATRVSFDPAKMPGWPAPIGHLNAFLLKPELPENGIWTVMRRYIVSGIMTLEGGDVRHFNGGAGIESESESESRAKL